MFEGDWKDFEKMEERLGELLVESIRAGRVRA